MGEVTIKVENLQRSIEFYTTIIGLKVLTQTGEQAILTTDGKRPILNLYVPKGVIKRIEEHPAYTDYLTKDPSGNQIKLVL
ncbi:MULTISPECIES: VOC family protein [Bacillaceae]|uniref:VOC family protein n=1 Tax=Bacillaceae TaxID=186817 RepID=UPI001D08D22F|nr:MULTISPECIES: VOC family protein [Bacillaceae]MCB5935559.1 VOC family protein [Bacillus sp. DFI.2.34]MDL0420053.1 VOC family protein [Caldibacillus thermoamylovorans]MED3642825.1 VOC family protein [Caldifermentibacillus hisashii]